MQGTFKKTEEQSRKRANLFRHLGMLDPLRHRGCSPQTNLEPKKMTPPRKKCGPDRSHAHQIAKTGQVSTLVLGQAKDDFSSRGRHLEDT